MISTEENSGFFRQASLAILPGEGTEEGNDDFGLMKYLCSHFEGFFNMSQNVTTWTDDFTSPPKEGVLVTCMALGPVWAREPWVQ
jgi:hypothetical protein